MDMRSNSASPIYWSLLRCQDWSLHLAASSEGLCFVGSPGHSIDELRRWAKSRRPASPLIRDDDRLAPYAGELTAYLEGLAQDFTLPMDYRGTPFQAAVWSALKDIPYGMTRTYTDIAREIHKPAAVRAVGAAIGANPLLVLIPCHRVIGRNGSLTGYRGGLEMKTRLLQHEQACLQMQEAGSRSSNF